MDQNHLVSGKMIVIDTGQNRLTIFSHLNFSSDFLLLFLVNLTMKSINITTISYLQHPRLINVPMVFLLYCYVKLVMDLSSPLHV